MLYIPPVVLADNSSGLVFRFSLAKGFNPEDAEVSLRLTEESFLAAAGSHRSD
jgi:hypothetical protein